MLNKIGQFIDAFFDQVLKVLQWLLDAVLSLLANVFYPIFDIILTGIEKLFDSIDFSGLSNLSIFSSWNDLPGPILYAIHKFRITEILAVLAVAYTIRLLLNLIPGVFTRV